MLTGKSSEARSISALQWREFELRRKDDLLQRGNRETESVVESRGDY